MKPVHTLVMQTKTSHVGTDVEYSSPLPLSPILSTEEVAALLRCSTDQGEQLAVKAAVPAFKRRKSNPGAPGPNRHRRGMQ